MTSHVSYPPLDQNGIGTFSHVINTEIARQRLGFDGVITTDAFGMKGLTNYFSPEESAVKAILAGADMILKRHGREANFSNLKALRRALQEGQITQERVAHSLKRIFALKQKYCTGGRPDLSTVKWNEAHARRLEAMGEESVTVVRNEEHLLPLKLSLQTKSLLIMPNLLSNASLDGMMGDSAGYIIRGILSDKYSYATDGFDIVHFGLDPYPDEINEIVEKAREYDLLILGSHRSNVRPRQAQMVRKIFDTGRKVIWIALNTPFDLLDCPTARTYVCTYGDRLPQLKSLCRILAGEITPKGMLPVGIPGLHESGTGIVDWIR
jgi:beta-N-acetylhexosaminidase